MCKEEVVTSNMHLEPHTCPEVIHCHRTTINLELRAYGVYVIKEAPSVAMYIVPTSSFRLACVVPPTNPLPHLILRQHRLVLEIRHGGVRQPM